MRTTIVPAQVTTVEDRIAGNLGLSQVILLIAPVFAGSALYVLLPSFFEYAAYKVWVIVVLALLCGVLAVRIKGKIVLLWALVLLRYHLRPTYYLFNKNSAHNRRTVMPRQAEAAADVPSTTSLAHSQPPSVPAVDLMKVTAFVRNPAANIHFTTTKKGELRVLLTEVPHENLSTSAN